VSFSHSVDSFRANSDLLEGADIGDVPILSPLLPGSGYPDPTWYKLSWIGGDTLRLTLNEGCAPSTSLPLPGCSYLVGLNGLVGDGISFSVAGQTVSVFGVEVPEPSTGVLLAAGLVCMSAVSGRGLAALLA